MKHRSKKKGQMTRRQILAATAGCGLGLAFQDPVKVLVQSLVDGIIQKAHGQGNPRNFVSCHLVGAPPWWHFLPLNAYGSDLVSHPNVTNAFASGSPTYQTVTLGPSEVSTLGAGETLNMPKLWSSQIPTSDGGWVAMAKVLEHMLIIQGVDMIVDGHRNNAYKQIRPSESGASLTGLVADATNRPIPAVGGGNDGVHRAYSSRKGVGQVNLSGLGFASNPLQEVLSPYDTTLETGYSLLGGGYATRRQALDNAISSALNSLGSYANSGNPGAENLFSMRSSAENLLQQGIGDASTAYPALFAKYLDLIARSALIIDYPIPGLTESAVSVSSFPAPTSDPNREFLKRFQTGYEGEYATNADFRTLIQHSTADPVFSKQGAILPNLAAGFAIAEYLIKQGLTASICFDEGIAFNVMYDNVKKLSDGSDVTYGTWKRLYNFDEHFCGQYVSMMSCAFLYRSLAACLYEFTQSLGSQLFSETVVQIASEFNRQPDDNLAGSQHEFRANACAILSGIIDKPRVLGNTLLSYAPGWTNHTLAATLGVSSPVNVDGADQKLTIGHSTSTIAELLRVDRPMTNNSPLVVETSSGVSPTIELARVVSS